MTTARNFLFLAYRYPEIWTAVKSDPRAYTDPKKPGSNWVKVKELKQQKVIKSFVKSN